MRVTDRIERALMTFVTRVPGYVVAGVALLLYGTGVAIPLLRRAPIGEVVFFNVAGATCAGVLILAWVIVQFEARERRHLVEWTTNLRLLTAEEFEWLIGELFRRQGWTVHEVGGHGTPDGNVDLEMSWEGERYIVQCKAWSSRFIGVDEIRRFAGTLFREGLEGSAGYFVTLSDFTQAARAEAEKAGMTLIDRRALDTQMSKVRRTEPCPICAEPMSLSKSIRGWWFRCVAEGCQGKRDLGSEPGRALELLTELP